MRVCSHCADWKEDGEDRGINFVCSDCVANERAHAREVGNRRERLAEGRIRYPCGNIVAIPPEEESTI